MTVIAPIRAVRTMAQWANDGRSGGATKRFYPRLQKNVLFGSGYIASHSAHSTGNTVDLTLVQVPPAPAAAFDPAAAYGPCTGPAAQRSPDTSIDMGAGYDCFDAASSTASTGITAEQRRRRYQLVAAMAKRGFANYHREWWHFSYGNRGPSPMTCRSAHGWRGRRDALRRNHAGCAGLSDIPTEGPS